MIMGKLKEKNTKSGTHLCLIVIDNRFTKNARFGSCLQLNREFLGDKELCLIHCGLIISCAGRSISQVSDKSSSVE